MNSNPVRVRFAPSPTGYLHIGGLRTALYNALFARRMEGTLILRIEDTDRSRYVEGAVENLLRTLDWAGLAFDEGPGAGGDHGPYVQSERLALYQEHADALLASGNAFCCFCTPEEITAARTAAGDETMRDVRCGTRDADDVAERIASGKPYTIRLRIPSEGDISFSDRIRGDITVPYAVIDEQILIKSDGFPTYHLANVVDDHRMRITHVIRGEEWLPSTGKHVLLYRAFGWSPPEFAHLPLLLNPDRSKLSKRQGDVAVEDYRAKGFLPDALINFVALLGWHPEGERELFSLTELVDAFSLERVSKSGAVFDPEKLLWFNSQYLKIMTPEAAWAFLRGHLAAAGIYTEAEKNGAAFAAIVVPRISLPTEAVEYASLLEGADFTFESDDARSALQSETSAIVLQSFVDLTACIKAWEKAAIKDAIKTVQKATGIKGKDLFLPLRVALTGSMHGPDLPDIMELFGREKCLQRLRAALMYSPA